MKALLVGIGGFLGSVLRYGAGGLLHRLLSQALFPWGTLAVNVLGCAAIGFCGGLAELRGLFSPEARLLVFIGLLGGFTTFSSFGYETFHLLRDGETARAAANVTAQMLLGLVAVWAGDQAARLIGGGP